MATMQPWEIFTIILFAGIFTAVIYGPGDKKRKYSPFLLFATLVFVFALVWTIISVYLIEKMIRG